MAKGKNKATAVAAPPKCVCDDPYKCACGNRPERPSRGHKWYPDDQIWAGKGHKQKGASGQTALVSEQAKVTATGKTQVAQWQRLPTQLLQEFCKSQKRPNPSFKNLGTNGQYRYRCIVHDPKRDSDKDLFFVPAQAVGNEEQAQEESALLALLQLTPNLPHERKLPDPYKTTWLSAIKSLKEGTKGQPTKKDGAVATKTAENISKNENSKSSDAKKSGQSHPEDMEGAVASTNLTLSTTYISNADKRQKMEERRRMQNARIRKHENIRRANQNHPVFMSVVIRQQIERLLRGDTSGIPNLEAGTDEEEEEGYDDNGNDVVEDNAVKMYVTHRLYSEGFSKRQAKNAFEQTTNDSDINRLDVDNEATWDRIYEECLQWLLVHLNEDQLPEGFDPRGRTLDVVIPVGKASTKSKPIIVSTESEASVNFATQRGITVQEASLVLEQANKENQSPEEAFWRVITVAAGTCKNDGSANDVSNPGEEMFNEEVEAIIGIFDSDCTITNEEKGLCRIRIEMAGDYQLDVVIVKDIYPNEHPRSVSVIGPWQSKVGAKVHIELATFISNLPLGEQMIFDIHGHAQDLLQSDDLVAISLLPYLGVQVKIQPPVPSTPSAEVKPEFLAEPISKVTPQHRHRPRGAKKTFWTTHPREMAPALALPKVSPMMERTRKSLPAFHSRSKFLDAIKEAERKGSRVVLVTGETGSGKSTQLPAYILEDDPVGSKIVVVQPRRIAATGVANRVAEERGEKQVGKGNVGYVVRGDSALCNQSRLVFCTTGVLLRQFQVEGALDCLTTIVIDEVHERNLDGDILLGLLKRVLPTKPHLRVVLMSATLATDSFKSYWGSTHVPHVHIPGRTFPVVDFFLEDVLRITGFVPSKKKKERKFYNNSSWYDVENVNKDQDMIDDPEPSQQNTKAVHHGIPIDELVGRVDEKSPDPDLICQLLEHIVANKDPSENGSILVFLAGTSEIKNLETAIKSKLVGVPTTVLPLHGGLQAKEQGRVFQPAQSGYTKVVLSTNVAETSVTIPDCTVVIDTGREKQASYDPENRMPLLIEQFASKASMKQRRGRAGRVREGTCYKLVSRKTFDSLQEHSIPEIQRVALDQTLLQLLFLGVEDGLGTFTNSLLDPPSKESLDAATFSLIKLGAIENKCNDGTVNITPLGSHLAGIPAPPVVGKILVMGSILGCRSAALAMAAGISLGRSIFLRLDNVRIKSDDPLFEETKREKVFAQREVLAKEAGNSDHALLAYTFLKWQGTESALRSRFCDTLGVSNNSLYDMSQLFNQLNNSLSEAGFYATPEADRYSSSWRIIQTCAVSGMAPSQLVKVRRPATKYHDTAEGAKEIDGVAKELSFFIRAESGNEERVFIHPSSINFSTGNYSCPYLVFNSMVRTSKPFLRDVTECNAYALLLFGGELQIQAAKGIVTVDNWAELSANARIGSLIGGLRRRIDSLLAEKILNPTMDVSALPEVQLVIKLVRTQGLGS